MAIHIEKLDKRDLRRLEIFCEIVEQGGISNATVSTGLSQPVLSNQLIELEKSLGVTLCKRGRSGFDLTSEGHTVYGYANELSNVLSDFAFKIFNQSEVIKVIEGYNNEGWEVVNSVFSNGTQASWKKLIVTN